MMSEPPRGRNCGLAKNPAREELLAELRRWEKLLALSSLDEAIRLIESEKASKLTDRHLHAIAEFAAIRIDEETFFDKAFSAGKEVAACLGYAMAIGWEETLSDMTRLRLTVTGPRPRDTPPVAGGQRNLRAAPKADS